MKGFVKFVLITITVVFVLSAVLLGGSYVFLRRYKSIEIDEKIINAQAKSGSAQLYAYNFYDRASRRGKPYMLEGFLVESRESFEPVDLDSVPIDLINAFVSIEDKRFYKHQGVDLLRTARAGLNYILKRSSSFGGSSITQQLVKNITGNSEKSIDRKIKEIFYARNLEKGYTKDEILCMYLNIINLGNKCRGVCAASKFYFSKEVSDLTLSECATIAAITNNPSFYDPVRNIENTRRRRDLILKCMMEQSYITEEEYRTAVNEDIELSISQGKKQKINSWYTDMVIEDVICDLTEKFDIDRDIASSIVYNGGLKIYTAIDEVAQGIVEDYYRHLEDSDVFKGKDGLKSSFILIDSKTGDILAVAGDVGEKGGNRILNFATGSHRPSGSAIKPLSVYAPAIDRGLIKWSSIYSDEPIKTVNGREWPQNANQKYIGNVDIDYAIANSLNTVSVRVLNDLGISNSLSFLKGKLHFTGLFQSENSDVGDECESSLALGQHKIGVTLKELSAGYTIFENGIYKKPRSYFKVLDADGNILLDNSEVQEKAISPESAFIMTKLLCGVVNYGTAKNKIDLPEKTEVAGKTGTSSGNCDRYFIGFTPDVIGGCWAGYEYPKKIDVAGNPTIGIWNDILTEIYSTDNYRSRCRSFIAPDGVRRLTYDRSSGGLPSLYTKTNDIKYGWFAGN